MIKKGTKVIVTRRATLKDYQKTQTNPTQWVSFPNFRYEIGIPYKVIRTTPNSVILNNAAEIPKFLVEKVK